MVLHLDQTASLDLLPVGADGGLFAEEFRCPFRDGGFGRLLRVLLVRMLLPVGRPEGGLLALVIRQPGCVRRHLTIRDGGLTFFSSQVRIHRGCWELTRTDRT